MHWLKRRVFTYRREDPHYTEVDHVCFFRLRSDGTIWYQLPRRSLAGMIHRVSGGILYNQLEGFLKEPTPYTPPVPETAFDAQFESIMKIFNGVEVPDFWD